MWVGQLIPAKEQIEILEIQDSAEDAEALLTVLQTLGEEGLQFDLTYRSIYGEKWLLSSETGLPVKISD